MPLPLESGHESRVLKDSGYQPFVLSSSKHEWRKSAILRPAQDEQISTLRHYFSTLLMTIWPTASHRLH